MFQVKSVNFNDVYSLFKRTPTKIVYNKQVLNNITRLHLIYNLRFT
jgi:hypothetical protein